MRLDAYLVEKKLISTRSKAKRAIKNGFIKVNDIVVKQPDWNIGRKDVVKVLDKKLAEMPEGYFKLKKLLEKIKIIEKADVILDLGSSSGGFLIAASELGTVYGIEISKDFEKDLKKIQRRYKNIKVVIGNVFNIDIKDVVKENVDVILNDLTLDPFLSFQALSRFLNVLKPRGKILMTLKLQNRKKQEVEEITREFATSLKLRVIEFLDLEDKKEIFVLMRKENGGLARI